MKPIIAKHNPETKSKKKFESGAENRKERKQDQEREKKDGFLFFSSFPKEKRKAKQVFDRKKEMKRKKQYQRWKNITDVVVVLFHLCLK